MWRFVDLGRTDFRRSETWVLITSTGRLIPEEGILHIRRCENLISYILRTCLASDLNFNV
jgi:hypothetical protein